MEGKKFGDRMNETFLTGFLKYFLFEVNTLPESILMWLLPLVNFENRDAKFEVSRRKVLAILLRCASGALVRIK